MQALAPSARDLDMELVIARRDEQNLSWISSVPDFFDIIIYNRVLPLPSATSTHPIPPPALYSTPLVLYFISRMVIRPVAEAEVFI